VSTSIREKQSYGFYVVLPLIMLITLLQSTAFASVRILGAVPDLTLIVVVGWAALQGPREGISVALIAGLFTDILSGAPLGISTIALALVGLVVGIGENNIFQTARFLPYAAIFVATMAHGIIFVFLLHATGHPMAWGTALGRVTAPSAVLNSILMLGIFPVLRWLASHTRIETAEWK